jgi:hypothetical protein
MNTDLQVKANQLFPPETGAWLAAGNRRIESLSPSLVNRLTRLSTLNMLYTSTMHTNTYLPALPAASHPFAMPRQTPRRGSGVCSVRDEDETRHKTR